MDSLPEKQIIPFRHSQTSDKPCLSRLPSIPGRVPGCEDQGSELNEAGHDIVHISHCPKCADAGFGPMKGEGA